MIEVVKQESQRSQWDIIQKKFLTLWRSLPLKNISSRNATAEILSFVGCKHQVIPLMQKISHQSRGFIYNADGLKGFLIEDILITNCNKKNVIFWREGSKGHENLMKSFMNSPVFHNAHSSLKRFHFIRKTLFRILGIGAYAQ